MLIEAPQRGLIFWPVGCGDSTTIVTDRETFVQVDINHVYASDDEDDPKLPVVDHLVKLLPKRGGHPYLAAFGLTHPDRDHSLGFTELLSQVTIGDLWFTPRILREADDLTEDAKAFQAEAKRRIAKNIKEGPVGSGDRIRVIGYDNLLREEEFVGLPEECLTVPGTAFTNIDGVDRSEVFRAFVHAPFKGDAAGERNVTSLGLQVRLVDSEAVASCLLLGDSNYPVVRRIFDYSEGDDLAWNILLAPHHCSKSVMYWADEEAEEETLRQDLLDDMAAAAQSPGWVVASSTPIPPSNKPGDNPPHAKAKARYEEIAPDGFRCTGEYPSEDASEPMVFELDASGLHLRATEGSSAADGGIAEAIAAARGAPEPPKTTVGFGR